MVFSISSSIKFSACWNEHNKFFRDTFLQKVSKFALYYLHKFAVREALPSTQLLKEAVKNRKELFFTWIKQNNLDAKTIEITTPDRAILKATFIKLKNCQMNSPLIIFSQPNSSIWTNHSFQEIILHAVQENKECNFLIYDYRGCGESYGDPIDPKEFVIDGDSVYQFAINYLKVPPENIHMMGYSFGGGVSAQVKALHPECSGKYVSDRSFTAIADVALERYQNSFLAVGAYVLLNTLGWNILNSKEALKKIKSKILVIFHPEDNVIKGISQLYKSIPKFCSRIIGLNLSQRIKKSLSKITFHGASLHHFTDENGKQAHTEVLDFIFSNN